MELEGATVSPCLQHSASLELFSFVDILYSELQSDLYISIVFIHKMIPKSLGF